MTKKLVLWTAVVFWMSVIFAFSAQPAIQSDELSLSVVDRIINFIDGLRDTPVFSNMDEGTVDSLISFANFCVRKSAHFIVFAILAVLVYNLLASYDMSRKNVVLLSLLICLLYAASDEFHQSFVPGRACQLRDVAIDVFGSTTALAIIYLFFGRRVKNKV